MLRSRWLGRGSKGLKKRAQRARFRCEGAAYFWAPKASEPYCLWKYGFPANLQSAWMTAGRVFWRMGLYFLATAATARMMRAMPRSSQKPKVRRKMRKEKRMEDSGSMAEIMLASVGRI